MKRLGSELLGLTVFAFFLNVATAQEKPPPRAEEENKIAPLQRFIGGKWVTQGKWSNGQDLRAWAVYDWGIGKKFVTAKTFVIDKDREYQRYEGVLGWHPEKKSLVHIGFAFNGEIGEVLVEAKDADTLHFGFTPYTEGQAQRVRQIVKFKDKDTFVWTVSMQTDQGWTQLIESTWHRKEK